MQQIRYLLERRANMSLQKQKKKKPQKVLFDQDQSREVKERKNSGQAYFSFSKPEEIEPAQPKPLSSVRKKENHILSQFANEQNDSMDVESQGSDISRLRSFVEESKVESNSHRGVGQNLNDNPNRRLLNQEPFRFESSQRGFGENRSLADSGMDSISIDQTQSIWSVSEHSRAQQLPPQMPMSFNTSHPPQRRLLNNDGFMPKRSSESCISADLHNSGSEGEA